MVKVPTVKTLKGFLTTRHRIELDVNIAVGVRVNSDVNDFTILLVALGPDFGFEVFYPAVAPILLFPNSHISFRTSRRNYKPTRQGQMHFQS